MARSLDILTEACASLRPIIKRMFGGHGFFAQNGGMFAGIVTDDAIVLKLESGPARDELLSLGGKPWTYRGKSKAVTMQNWIVVPENFYDDEELLGGWAKRARDLAPPKKAARKRNALDPSPADEKRATNKRTTTKTPPKKAKSRDAL